MKKSFSEKRIIKILAELEAGSTIAQVSRKHGVHVTRACLKFCINGYTSRRKKVWPFQRRLFAPTKARSRSIYLRGV